MLSLYSLIWTFLISCPIILLIFILRRRSDYLNRYGVTFILILYIFCTVRMLIPIEFPEHQKIIRDPYLFSYIMKVYADLGPSGRRTALYVILGIWAVGSLILCIYNFIVWNIATKSVIKRKTEDDGRAERILKKIDKECNLTIRYSSVINEAFVQGLFHPIIYLPQKECNDKELEFVLRHEYLHWKRKDLWKKKFLLAMNIIFWWNPLAYLLSKDLNQIIELNCDDTMAEKYGELEVLDYLDTLTYMAGGRRKNFEESRADGLGFIKEMDMHPVKQRFKYVMFRQENKKTRKRANLFITCFCMIWLVGSYYLILQPDYSVPNVDMYEQNTPFVADDANSYLEEQEDGSYLFYYGKYTERVSKEDVESGIYRMYPIIKYEKK